MINLSFSRATQNFTKFRQSSPANTNFVHVENKNIGHAHGNHAFFFTTWDISK